MKASEMANEELAECIESARLAPAKYVREDGLNYHREAIREAAARLRNLGEIGEEVGLEATREKSSQVGNAQEMRDALVAMVEAETGGTMERDYLCGRCLERMFDRCKHDGSCWVDKVMNALAEAKGEAK